MQKYTLWEQVPGLCEETPTITAYIPENKKSNAAVVILPGGGYRTRAAHEGEAYAQFFQEMGVCAFVCDYRVAPHRFPLPLLDARRAMRWVRYNAEKYGIDKNKIAIMGSSAGGHLAALTSTYLGPIDHEGVDDIDREDFIPNAQILCYPVIKLSVDKTLSHTGSCVNLLGVEQVALSRDLTPQYLVSAKTPPCFVWHTLTDGAVPVTNSMDYAAALRENKILCELHVFPEGVHGLGLARGEEKPRKHASIWTELLLRWLKYIDFV